MAKENKKKYVVIKTNTLNHKVNDVIELTDAKAKSLVGKVRLMPEVTKPKSAQQVSLSEDKKQ